MASAPTAGELVKAAAITREEIEAAIEAYLANLNTGTYLTGGGYLLDLATFVAAHTQYERERCSANGRTRFLGGSRVARVSPDY